LGAINPTPEPIKVKFGREERTSGPLLPAEFDLDRCNVSPLLGEKPQYRPVSKRNTGRSALRADPAGNKPIFASMAPYAKIEALFIDTLTCLTR